MIGQIGYLGQVSRRIGIVSAVLYEIGAVSGASLLGLVFGAVGMGTRWLFHLDYLAPSAAPQFVIGGLALLGGLLDLGAIPARLLEPSKQLPRHWLAVFGPYRTSFLWGLHVGIGRKTRVGSTLYYILIAWIVLVGNPRFGALVLGLYGLSHGLLLIAEVSGIALRTTDPLQGLLGLARSDFLFRYAGVALVLSGVFLLAYPFFLNLRQCGSGPAAPQSMLRQPCIPIW
jgi:hypothetical protein